MSEIYDIKTLDSLSGGISISGALVNSLTSGIKIILDLGRSFGTAVRRTQTGSMCPLW